MEHTVKAFDEDITQLRGLIAEMGGLAQLSVTEAITALETGDNDLAQKVRKRDAQINALEAEIDRLAVRLIALRAPMADDLREVVAALKISGVLERIGKIEGRKHFEPLTLIPAMGELAGEMVHDVLDAFAARDAARAKEIIARDDKVDAFYDSIFRNVVTHMVENPQTIGTAAQMLFIARNIERIADHACNVAEQVYFAATGNTLVEDGGHDHDAQMFDDRDNPPNED